MKKWQSMPINNHYPARFHWACKYTLPSIFLAHSHLLLALRGLYHACVMFTRFNHADANPVKSARKRCGRYVGAAALPCGQLQKHYEKVKSAISLQCQKPCNAGLFCRFNQADLPCPDLLDRKLGIAGKFSANVSVDPVLADWPAIGRLAQRASA